MIKCSYNHCVKIHNLRKYKKGLKEDESLQNGDLSNKSSDRIDS